MKRTVLVLILFFSVGLLAAQKNSLRLIAFQRNYISGVAPTPVIEIGGKEISVRASTPEPEYFIYLLSKKLSSLKIESVWIKKHLYPASMVNVPCKPVLLTNGLRQKDTLVGYTDEDVWQIKITGKAKNTKPKKDIAALLRENELVVKIADKQSRYYTRSVRYITKLEPDRGQ